MTTDARQAAEATDYTAKARELDNTIICLRFAPESFRRATILAALQSAHATGEAKGDAAGFERGVKEAAAKAAAHVKPPTAFVSRAAIKADILALLPSQPKEPT